MPSSNLLSITNSKGRQVNLLNDDNEHYINNKIETSIQTKRRFHCTESGCRKSFTTSGHLARHHRIHTGEKNFHCIYPGCPSRFSRQDNMMQHYRTHMSSRSRHHHYLHHYQQQHHHQQQQQQILHCHSYFGSENNELYSLGGNNSSRSRGWSSFSSASSSSTYSWSTPPPPPLHANTASTHPHNTKPHISFQPQPRLPTQDWINSSNKYLSSSYYYNEFV